MKKIKFILFFFFILVFSGCSSDTVPLLGGSYQSEPVEGYVIQMGVQADDKTFVEYIDNREVDRGTYEEKSANVYLFKGEKQEFEATLSPEDSFHVAVNQLNEGGPIALKNIDKVPTYFSTEFDDVEEYEKLLQENEEDIETEIIDKVGNKVEPIDKGEKN